MLLSCVCVVGQCAMRLILKLAKSALHGALGVDAAVGKRNVHCTRTPAPKAAER